MGYARNIYIYIYLRFIKRSYSIYSRMAVNLDHPIDLC